MRRLIWMQTMIVIILLLLFRTDAGADFGAKDSVYTPKIIELIQNWPPVGLPSPDDTSGPLWLEAIRTEGNSSYIGLRKRMYIHAPMAQVSRIVEDFASYPTIHPEVEEVHVIEHESNLWVIDWIRDRPAFFLPKIIYEQIYISQESEGRKFYRYQLKSGNAINYADGVIVLEPAPEGIYLTSYDFFEGNFGIAKLFAKSKIWRDSLMGYARADYALKIKAENPDWSLKQIQTQVKALMDHFPFHPDQVHYINGLDVPKKP